LGSGLVGGGLGEQLQQAGPAAPAGDAVAEGLAVDQPFQANEAPVSKDAIQQFSPELFHYISHLHIAVSGFIAATGLAVLFLVAYGVRRGSCGPRSDRSPTRTWSCGPANVAPSPPRKPASY
jgi:hypothetical protein